MADKESKKRKRLSNGVNTPSKKVAVDAIRVSFNDSSEHHPVLLSAPRVNAPNIPFKAYAKASRARKNVDTVKPATHDLLLQSSQHPRLDYTAVPDTLDQHTSHYLAVFDPATNELHIAPAHHVSLRTTLRSDSDDEEKSSRTYAQQREELGREFGTNKAKKAILSRTANAITQDTKGKAAVTDVQSAILESVGDTTAGAAHTDAQQEADAQLAAKPIPMPNLAATTVEEVYPLSLLIPASDMRSLHIKEWQDKVNADEEVQFKHRYPANRVAGLVKSDALHRLQALRYLTLLLEFHDCLGSNRGGKKVPKKDILSKRLAGWPGPLVDSVRRRFSADGTELSKWHLDNLYTHMSALTLYIDNWTTDTSNLRDDLKLETKQIQQYFQELGCKVSAPTESEKTARKIGKAMAAITRIAKLRLPLEFPKPRAGASRRR